MPPLTTPRWLLLAHQLPTRSSNARVKTWRRLQQIGAVSTRNSVYVLPNTEPCREDFEWIRAEITALGGEATVFAADAVNQDGADDIVAAFRRGREADYRALKREADRLAGSRRSRRTVASRDDAAGRAIRTLRERLNEVRRVDFFSAPGGSEAEAAVSALERTLERPAADTKEIDVPLSRKDFSNRRWVTRSRPGVDRMASAWLIRRFIDPKATFGFTERPQKADVPFDMYVGEFSHQGSLCTFETLAQRFGLADATVTQLAHIVHDLDMKDTRYAAPETPAVGRLVAGLRQMHPDDATLLEQGVAMFEALARSFASTAPSPPIMRASSPKPSRRRR